ncbi:DNA-binding response regulator [Putridiphycobacter roseus]|uniref:DNA-binding response regulator n=1 Tax=Putridiphycobacter roseus TaxID=2219161 RepID=A0A2W1MXT5_9FLAO|nr:response regulator transcription factor [Putridiphycobacter roseus]PZE16969.1 DNA-binding response regulator [Putridiphycobacter roseus]
MNPKIKIAVVDDHQLFRGGLVKLIHSLSDDFQVSLEAKDGLDFLSILSENDLPQLAMIDINMPRLDGFGTVEKLKKLHPEMLILILTMNDDEQSLIRMLKLGVNGYIGKDIDPDELKIAIDQLLKTGHYYNDQMTQNLIHSIQSPDSGYNRNDLLNEQEIKFIALACSEHTYTQIADLMCLSPKTIDGYRASVFEKLEVKSRVGLAIYAIKTGIYKL